MFAPTAETVQKRVRRAGIDDGLRPGSISDESERLKKLERENWELRRANELLRSASLSSRPSSTVDARRDQVQQPSSRQVRGRAGPAGLDLLTPSDVGQSVESAIPSCGLHFGEGDQFPRTPISRDAGSKLSRCSDVRMATGRPSESNCS